MNTPFKVNRGGVIDLNLLTLAPMKQDNKQYDAADLVGVNGYQTLEYVPVDWWLDGYCTRIGVSVRRDLLLGNYAVDFYNWKPTEWMADLWLVKAMDCGTIGGGMSNHDPCIGKWYRWHWAFRKWEEILGYGVRQNKDAEYVNHLRSLGVFAKEPYPQPTWR